MAGLRNSVLNWLVIAGLFALLAILLWAAVPCYGSLSAQVTPGIFWETNTPLTVDNLNLTAMPIILISGTVGGGTNGGIAPDSISGIEMLDSFPDGGVLNLPYTGTPLNYTAQTMGWNGNTPRQLAVNTAGIIDSYGGLRSYNTNALELLLDPTYFLLSTNSLGGTNGNNSGSVNTNFLTLKPNSIWDTNIVPGGISSGSITPTGLYPFTLNTEQIFTNIFVLSGSNATNTWTNFSTVVVGAAPNAANNGLGEVVALGSGLIIAPVPTQIITNSGGTLYTDVDQVATLQIGGTNGALPLENNVGPWTNVVDLPVPLNSTNWQGTNAFVTTYNFGGLGPTTNIWTWGVLSSITISFSSAYLTNVPSQQPGTNGTQVMLVTVISTTGNGQITVGITNTLYDATGQRAVSPPAYIGFHHL